MKRFVLNILPGKPLRNLDVKRALEQRPITWLSPQINELMQGSKDSARGLPAGFKKTCGLVIFQHLALTAFGIKATCSKRPSAAAESSVSAAALRRVPTSWRSGSFGRRISEDALRTCLFLRMVFSVSLAVLVGMGCFGHWLRNFQSLVALTLLRGWF